MKRRVVITGLGTINPLGNDTASTWAQIKNNQHGIGYIKRYTPEEKAIKIAAEIKDFDFEAFFGPKLLKRYDRFIQVALVATKEAMLDSGLDVSTLDATRIGVYYGSGIGGLESISEQERKGLESGFHRVSPFFIPMSIINLAAGNIAIEYGIKGPALAHVTACASASNSIGEAFRAIKDGYIDRAVTGGAEAAITPLGIGGFQVMHALHTGDDINRASIPFDQERSGFVMGEGAATLILEDLDSALARGAKIYGEIVGYGQSCDASHITAPDPLGEGAVSSMRQAVSESGHALSDVHYINAHGTSTPLNDKTETLAIKRLFEDHAYKLKVSSTKSMTGHLLGASGAVEAMITILALQNGFIPATLNYQTKDPECDLDIVPNHGIDAAIELALSNSLGFGGHNATLAFKKWSGQ
jgi:3-oxoacyl-[acyl-carrier-protein] synthase II